MVYELAPGTVPLSALREASAKGFARCEPVASVSEARVLYSVEGGRRRIVGVVSSPDHVGALLSSRSRLRVGGITDIASVCGVTRGAVDSWVKRYPEFPKPIGSVHGSRLWDLHEVLEWNARWRPYGRHLRKPVEATNL